MQEQICHALSNCPSMSMMRVKKDEKKIKDLLLNPAGLRDFVYDHIQVESTEFCSWTLSPVNTSGALQDAFLSLVSDSKRGQEPTFVVTSPEIADYISTCLLYTSPSPRDKRQSRMPSSA